MAISVFDLFKIGIGPSSSHTVGPMVAAKRFVARLHEQNLSAVTAQIRIETFGSLAHTGRGHGTDKALILGLLGFEPATVDLDQAPRLIEHVRSQHSLALPQGPLLHFDPKHHLHFNKRELLPVHSNGMRFTALDAQSATLTQRDYFSIGGGFVIDAETHHLPQLRADATAVLYPFHSAAELIALCQQHGLSIAQLMLENETAWRPRAEIKTQLLTIWNVMKACMQRGCATEGVLPGGLKVKRRAPQLHKELSARPENAVQDPLNIIDWINLFALAVNEENAAGGRVVTAPTNGAAGIIPAIGLYYERFVPGANDEGIVNYLLTAAAIGLLYKENASISGAEVGCQGEVGVACSMAAAGLAAVKGGTPMQVENAAEIGMEHNLGLTCDPVGGLVQIPCIERNAMGAVKALNAARLALCGDGTHKVSLDKVIKTMRETGADMQSKYKETSRGGLAVNVVEC